ncbi:hypothetical protein [Rhizobium phage RHEph27]|uniref:Uncharacterized protein n=1 Tax=Rhizobium phage RHph_TM34 TaxID=2509556 RepID=A0A7S5R7L0_9CAUD|nr:hypothetical protein EVB35_009 [Rhizobium phage RHph_TM34]QXV74964.1 hypothetical protein [Rhizobium phage RHEph27]
MNMIPNNLAVPTTGDKGGVCHHSTAEFWQEYDLYRITGDANIHDRIEVPLRVKNDVRTGMKRIIYRRNSTMGTAWMIPTAARRQIWEMLGVELGGRLIEDEFFHLSKPLNLGGGRFTRKISLLSWDAPADSPGVELGYVHECGVKNAWDKPFYFNDYTQNRQFYVSEQRDPNKKRVRGLGNIPFYRPSQLAEINRQA